jgi:hypothetical protein
VLPFRWCLTTSLESVQPVPAPDDLAGLVAELRFRLLLQREKKRDGQRRGANGQKGKTRCSGNRKRKKKIAKSRKGEESLRIETIRMRRVIFQKARELYVKRVRRAIWMSNTDLDPTAD